LEIYSIFGGKNKKMTEQEQKLQAYCLKCKQNKIPLEQEIGVNEKGTRTLRGKCPTCGTKMFKFLKKDKEVISDGKSNVHPVANQEDPLASYPE